MPCIDDLKPVEYTISQGSAIVNMKNQPLKSQLFLKKINPLCRHPVQVPNHFRVFCQMEDRMYEFDHR